MRRSIFILFSLAAVLLARPVLAWQWSGSNTISLPEYGVTVSRPDDRWRVLTVSAPALLQLRYLKLGSNPTMTLSAVRDAGRLGDLKKNRRARRDADKIAERLLGNYKNQGYAFYKTEWGRDGGFWAEATDASRRILMVYLKPRGRDYPHEWFRLELEMPRELYNEFSEPFHRVAQSLAVK